MTTHTGPTPFLKDLEGAKAHAPWSARRHILEGLDGAYRQGWEDAKAEDAPLLEAAKAATAILNIPDDGRFHATEEALLILLAAIAQAEGRE